MAGPLLRALLAVLLLLTAASVPAGSPATLTVAAAADLVHCLADLDAAFRVRHPEAVLRTTTGASGNFVAQIRAGAPFDVFLSADLRYPQALADAGLANPATLLRYATGRLALWTLRDDLDLSAGLSVLGDARVRRVAMANPAVAPYGRAAREALTASGLWTTLEPRLVFGENIAQTAQFVRSGNVDVGLVSLSTVRAPQLAGVGRHVEIPPSLHLPLAQGAIVTARGRDNPLAAAYLAFLGSTEARAIFRRHGFLLPGDEAGP